MEKYNLDTLPTPAVEKASDMNSEPTKPCVVVPERPAPYRYSVSQIIELFSVRGGGIFWASSREYHPIKLLGRDKFISLIAAVRREGVFKIMTTLHVRDNRICDPSGKPIIMYVDDPVFTKISRDVVESYTNLGFQFYLHGVLMTPGQRQELGLDPE